MPNVISLKLTIYQIDISKRCTFPEELICYPSLYLSAEAHVDEAEGHGRAAWQQDILQTHAEFPLNNILMQT